MLYKFNKLKEIKYNLFFIKQIIQGGKLILFIKLNTKKKIKIIPVLKIHNFYITCVI